MAIFRPSPGTQARTDQSALLLMLAYVEAECRALGAEDAARHVATALALLTPRETDAAALMSTPCGRA